MIDKLSKRPDKTSPLRGSTVETFRLGPLLGVGGTAEVYRAMDPDTGDRVAVKVLAAKYVACHRTRARFRLESLLLSKITSERVVRRLGRGKAADGRPCLITEYVRGVPLGSVIQRQRRLPWREAARIGIDILQGLEAVHRSGIAHRDVKPGNILIQPSGRAKLCDFGIATRISANLGRRSPDPVLGTPHYVSPEQARGENVDARTDIYSLAVVLYHLTTGRVPFHADSVTDLLTLHCERFPLRPDTIRRDIPTELSEVLLCALAKNPDNRWPDAHTFCRELEALLGSEAAHRSGSKKHGFFDLVNGASAPGYRRACPV